jgi:beta-glucosidase
MGQDKDFPVPGVGMPADLSAPHQIIDGRNASSKPVLLSGAIEGHVLVKNINNAVPLKAPKFLSIFGFSAKAPDQNDFSGGAIGAWTFGAESSNLTDLLDGFVGGSARNPSGIAINGTIFSGGGSGATSQSLVSAPFDAITQQCWEDDTEIFWDFTSGNPKVYEGSEACLVIVNAFASESYDRPGLRDDYTDGLILNVANQCNNTVVIIHNAGPRVVDQFIEHPNVTALIFAHLPGQYSGKALVSILYGQSNPSGKLPYTVAKNESDYGAMLDPNLPDGIYIDFPQANFTEGVFIDYRHFDANALTPRYEFGFGLSYTTFNYSNLQITKTNGNFAQYPTGAVLEGGQADLWDVLVNVTANVANTGSMGGAEVAQLYVGLPGAGGGTIPVRQLRGFDKPFINATETATVGFGLTRRDLSVWDTTAQKWSLLNGTYTSSVGPSSRNLPLVGTFAVP